MLDELRLVFAALQAPPRHELHVCVHHEYVAQSLTDRIRKRNVDRRTARELDAHGERWFLLDGRRLRLDQDLATDLGLECAHHLAVGRREDVDAAHDQHVVGSTEATYARARASTAALAQPHPNVIARAEAQQWGCAMPKMSQHKLAGGAVVQLDRDAGL